jgi:membrane protein DedA with SNARE-associated domain
MFNNIGKKLMTVAKICCWAGILISLTLGLILIFGGGRVTTTTIDAYGMPVQQNGSATVYGIMVIIVGCLGSWIGSLAIYGFGQLIEDNSAMRKLMEEKK